MRTAGLNSEQTGAFPKAVLHIVDGMHELGARDDGLRVIVVRKKGAPIVAAKLLVKTGGEADPARRAAVDAQ